MQWPSIRNSFAPIQPLIGVTAVIAGCGSSTPHDHAANAVIEIGHDEKKPPVEAAMDDPADEIAPVPRGDDEPADVCLSKMREGRGLNAQVSSSDAGLRYGEALVHERANQLDKARRGYLAVIQQFPESPVVPLTYFAFGELFYAESHSDPAKSMLAEQSYEEVLKYPPPTNTAAAFSYFRLASIKHESGKGPEALNMLVKLENLAESKPSSQCVISLLEPGRKLMVNAFANAGQPDKAMDFFMKSMSKEGSGKTYAFEMLAQLCDIYIQKRKPMDAANALLGIHSSRGAPGFCAREEGIMARIGPLIPPGTRTQINEAHHARCEMP